MSVIDQRQLTDAIARAKAPGSTFLGGTYSFSKDWIAALHALNRLAMPDMLLALAAISGTDRNWLPNVEEIHHAIGESRLIPGSALGSAG